MTGVGAELLQIGHGRPEPEPSLPVVEEGALSVTLVCMPWALVDMPSLAISTIAPLFAGRGEVGRLDALDANIRWLDYLTHRVGLAREHHELVVDAEVLGVGEWIFSSCFRPDTDPRKTSFFELLRGHEQVDAYCEMFRAAPRFVDELRQEIVESRADVVGLTTTFDQNIASFALARRVKELSPTTVTVLGGANCDGVQGTAIHQARTEVDYVVRGEAEPSRELVLSPGLETEAYRALAKGRTLPALARQLDDLGISVIDGRLEALVEEWTTLGLTFRERSAHLALATGRRW